MLVFSSVGYIKEEIVVANRSVIDMGMVLDITALDELVVVAFGQQEKESVISAIESVNTKELRVPSSNLTTALAGRIAGLIAYQTSGEPGHDNAEFFIRGVTSFGTGKVDPLILIDNVEVTTTDLSRMHPDDIQSFSILKDATATALYGARGANGVILITTKEGVEGKARISFRFENSFSTPTKELQMADPITYMRMANEAARTRDPLANIPYTNKKIDETIAGTNQYVYPAVDWQEEMFKNMAANQRANMNISGGGKVARYYIAGSMSQDNGILKVDDRNNYNSNVNLKRFTLRSNININLTESTEAIVRMHGAFDDYNGPIPGGTSMYKSTLQVSPVRFPSVFTPDSTYQFANHTLFGGDAGGNFMNPYAEMVKGYRQESKTVMLSQLEFKQDFGKWLPGLTGRLLGNTTRNSSFDLTRAYSPYYYGVMSYEKQSDEYKLLQLNPESGSEHLSYEPGYKRMSSSFYGEASLAYNQIFGVHSTSGMLVFIGRNRLDSNAENLSESLPKRNLGFSGRVTYGYDLRYFGEFNFGYNGSEKFDKGHRWGFFPSVGVGWVISNEAFWQSISQYVSNFKIRGTYGLVGNDEIGDERFFYLSRVNVRSAGGYNFGYNFDGSSGRGTSISHYANPLIGWETAYKTNLGVELGLFENSVNILADFFDETRKNILQTRADIPSSMGLWSIPQANVGEANSRGLDVSVDYTYSSSQGTWVVARGNFTYAKGVFKEYEEPDFSDVPWRSRIDMPITQEWGYVAQRLFIDQADVDNSPRQDFGDYMSGDIKYKDINGDNIIDEFDKVPIGYPKVPEINYGFGVSVGWKNFDVSCFFQGSARVSFWIDSYNMSPFRIYKPEGQDYVLETGLAKFIADNYWSEASENPQAGWPRLSNYAVSNNNQKSTWWMKNGSFLRLKTAEVGYALPDMVCEKILLSSCRIYLSGSNLLVFSKFHEWDVEMGGNGLNYPLQRVFNLGVNLTF